MEVSSLLAQVLFMGSEEVAGVNALHHALKELPMDHCMLDTQAAFLLKKAQKAATAEAKLERLQLALSCADRGTVAAPSEFNTWARLAQVYVAMEDWENALTILNSCPMFAYQDKDTPLMPEPRDVMLPILPETRLDDIDSEPEMRFSEQVDPSLRNLRAAGYKGTFKAAYSILAEMTAKIGWDQLLKTRSAVFVMEDEYRTERQEAYARNPSTDGLRGTPDLNARDDEDEDTPAEKPNLKTKAEDEDDSENEESQDDKALEAGETIKKPSDDAGPSLNGGDDNLKKPSHTIDPKEVKADNENVSS